MTGLDYTSLGEWLSNQGPDNDVVVSSRIRLARNLAGFNFINRAEQLERSQMLTMAKQHMINLTDPTNSELLWIDLNQISDIERRMLAERHLISKEMIKGEEPRAVIVNKSESLSIMINEEDHYRIQVIKSGHQLSEAYKIVNDLDDQLEQYVQYAFHSRFGYLTACPTNIGTGIRISVMLHLPALTITNEIERVRRAAKDMHLAIRGFYGEGSEALGDLYQISNQTTLGKNEQELMDEFNDRIIPVVIEYEREARNLLKNKRTELLDDRCFRAIAILRNARVIKANEAMKLLSHARLGVELQRINNISITDLNRLMLLCQPAHLQYSNSQQLTQSQRSGARADLFRSALSAGADGN